MTLATALLLVGASSLLGSVSGFYLPGAAPRDYVGGETVDLFVNALTPMLAGDDHAKLVSVPFHVCFWNFLTDLHQKSLINCELCSYVGKVTVQVYACR